MVAQGNIERYDLNLKVPGSRYKAACTVNRYNGKLWFDFPFNRELMAAVKNMQGHLWCGYDGSPGKETAELLYDSDKIWAADDCYRNWFRLRYMSGEAVFKQFDELDEDIDNVIYERPLYDHQKRMANRILHSRCGVWAADPGVGKTLSAIEVMERSGYSWDKETTYPEWIWVGPKSALASVIRQFRTWNSTVIPDFFTYNKFVTYLQNWPKGRAVPRGIVFDESHNLVNPTAQRSQAAQHITDEMRATYGDSFNNPDGPIIIAMTGTPQPKSPENWWQPCELACPGFIVEGSYNKFKYTVGEYEDDPSGYKKLIAYDKEAVQRLSKRLRGLVTVVLKHECLDLPDKVYVQHICPVTTRYKNIAKVIAASAKTKASALVLLRELSDGFQYKNVDSGTFATCKTCIDSPGQILDYDADGQEEWRECPDCKGTCEVEKQKRVTTTIPCPKDDVLREELKLAEEHNRLVVYAGFEGSIDRCVELAHSEGWDVIRWDGRGPCVMEFLPEIPLPDCNESSAFEELFQLPLENPEHPAAKRKICFIGHPGAAGAGLTLTAAVTIVYFSNDFNGASRMQSEDRIHRISSRGARIVDILHLETDLMILTNLTEKRSLQALSLNDMRTVLDMQNQYEGVLGDD